MRKSHKEQREKKIPPEFYVKVNHFQDTEVVREANPEDEWDGDDLSHSHSFQGCCLIDDKNGWWDFVLNKDPRGKELYLVYVLHTTGDSFHHEDNCLCMVMLVDNIGDAQIVVKAIEDDYKEFAKTHNYKSVPLNIYLPNSKCPESIGGTGTWKGYFEGLQSVNIEQLGKIYRH